jgi:hypothetical protein
MAYQQGQSVCPRCGSGEQVRTARELFDMMNGGYAQNLQRLNQIRHPGFGPGPGADDDDYDHYTVEGSDARRGIGGPGGYGGGGGFGGRSGFGGRRSGYDHDSGPSGDFGSDVAGAAISGALGFANRAFGRRLQRTFEEKVKPAMEAKAAQVQQQWEQSKADQEVIVQRYPELRCCARDSVLFLDGGVRTAPISDLKMPFVTVDQADALVARLR